MPKITDLQIQKNNKTRANVYIDGEFAFALEMLTVMKLGIKIGSEVSNDSLKAAVFDSEKSVAFSKAADYLGRGMRTKKQVEEYLTKKGYSKDVTEYVVERLEDYKYVDDGAYAAMYSEQAGESKGNRRIRMELMQKGISRETAESVSIDGETLRVNAEKLAVKYMRNKQTDVKTLQKLQRYLLGRGYDFDVVNSIVRGYNVSDE